MLRQDRLSLCTSIEDLRLLAQRRVPRAFFEYMDHGSYSQSTLRANCRDIEALKLKQRVAIDVSQRRISAQFAGQNSMPRVSRYPPMHFFACASTRSRAGLEASNRWLTRWARNGHRLALKAQAHCEERNLLPEF